MQAIDQLIDSRFAEILECRPELENPCAARHLRGVQHAVTLITVDDVSASRVQRLDQRIAITADDDATVVGCVQCLVAIEGPGVSQFDTFG